MEHEDHKRRAEDNDERAPERPSQEQDILSDSETERQMEIAKKIMQEYRATLAALAKK